MQGEILRNLWEYRILRTSPRVEGQDVESVGIHHPLVVVLTADCDLLQDYNARTADGGLAYAAVDESKPAMLGCVLMCSLFTEEEIKMGLPGSDVWKRVKRAQDERYHRLLAGDITGRANSEFPDQYLDFRKAFALPSRAIYEGIEARSVTREAVVPPIFVHDLMHRFFGYLSRVGIPTLE